MNKYLFYFLLICKCSLILGQGSMCFNQNGWLQGYRYNAKHIAKADFNSDGKEDICVPSDGIDLILSTNTNTYNTAINYTTGIYSHAVVVGDFNNDTKWDAAVSNFAGNEVTVFYGTGTGAIASYNIYYVDSGPTNIVAGDYNSDGKLDIATANSVANSLSLLLSTPNNTFAITNQSLGGIPANLNSGDIDNDGKLDLLIYFSNSIGMFKGNGSGVFINAGTLPLACDDGILVNADANSNLDIIYINDSTGTLNVLNGNGNFAFATSITQTLSPVCENVLFEDLNSDGLKDIAVLCYNGISTFAGNGLGNFNPAGFFGFSGFSLFTFISLDLNNDGKLDFAASHDNTNYLMTFFNCNAVGIDEKNSNAQVIVILPNPASNKLTIKNNSDFEAILVKITDLGGRLLHDETLEIRNGTGELDIDLINGVYFITIQDKQERTVTRKLVVAR